MDRRHVEFIPRCIVVALKRKSSAVKHLSADELFCRLVKANSCLYWNLNMKEAFDNCELVGWIRPHCLLIRTTDIFIQAIKLAYQKRLLKAPECFFISYVGDVDSVSCGCVQMSQFVSLDEALCYIIYDLNLKNESSSFDLICSRLAEWYPGLQLPPHFLILATLRSLLDAGQVYYTGYGYNIMTNDKMAVAQWLEEQLPVKSNQPQQSENSNEKSHKSSSLSDVSNIEFSELKLDLPKERAATMQSFKSRPAKSMDTMNAPAYAFNPTTFGQGQVLKRTKNRSMVRQFFSKLKPRSHKSQPSSSLAIETPFSMSVYDEESNYYAFVKSQPFHSSNIDFSPRFYVNASVPSDISKQEPQWLWNTSLQSLSQKRSSCRRSFSSHSRLSTQAIHDESPTRDPSASHKIKSLKGKHRHRSSHSSKADKSCSRSREPINYLTKDLLQEDSGVHSTSGSHSKGVSDPSSGHGHSYSHRHFKSLELEPISPPLHNYKAKEVTGLSRSFSTRLTNISGDKSLDFMNESNRLSMQSDRHVAFQESVGTLY